MMSRIISINNEITFLVIRLVVFYHKINETQFTFKLSYKSQNFHFIYYITITNI